jgi:hypothetical protein
MQLDDLNVTALRNGYMCRDFPVGEPSVKQMLADASVNVMIPPWDLQHTSDNFTIGATIIPLVTIALF